MPTFSGPPSAPPPIAQPIVVQQPKPPNHNGLIIAGWIFAVIFPPIGFILGILVANKGRVLYGVTQMVLAVVVVCWLISKSLDAVDSYQACVDTAHTLFQRSQC